MFDGDASKFWWLWILTSGREAKHECSRSRQTLTSHGWRICFGRICSDRDAWCQGAAIWSEAEDASLIEVVRAQLMEELFRKVYYAKAAAAAGEAPPCVTMICQDGSTTKIGMAQLNMYQPPRRLVCSDVVFPASRKLWCPLWCCYAWKHTSRSLLSGC